MSFLRGIDIAASGMTAQRLRMDVIANNLANAETTRTSKGGPYRRQMVIFEERKDANKSFQEALGRELKIGSGVRVKSIVEDSAPLRRVYDPSHPDADPEGYVNYPNVNVVEEMVDMIAATRSYEANVTVIGSIKNMTMKALDIGR
jgi:flagellar basal-body rod protein FlgC